MDKRLEMVWRVMKVALGVGPFLAGLDKFFNVLVDWSIYVSPLAERVLPVSAPTLMRAVGVVEMVVGIAILTRWTRIGAYVATAWLTVIALNLLASGTYFDLAVRDLEIAVGAWALARLTEVRESVPLTESPRVPGHGLLELETGA